MSDVFRLGVRGARPYGLGRSVFACLPAPGRPVGRGHAPCRRPGSAASGGSTGLARPGLRTRSALRAFQADRGLSVGGRLDDGPTLAGHGASVRSIAFSPDGRRLLSGSLDGTARLWAVEEALSLEGGVDLIEVAAHKGYSRPMPRCR